MKIAFDHQIFTEQSYGGISRYYKILAAQLSKQKENVKIFSGIHCNQYLHDLPDGITKGVGVNRYPKKTGRFFKCINHSISQCQIKLWKPDIIHETYYSSLPRLSFNSIKVTTVYDMIHELYQETFSSRDKTTQWKKDTLDRVDHIISISHNTKQDLVDIFGIEEKKISVVHLGVDSASFIRSESRSVNSGRPFLLYVGGRSGYKNFSSFLKAVANSARLMKECDIVVFGGGIFSNHELSIINSLGFKELQVRQLGGSDEVLAKLYNQAIAFVYPSLYEGFGLPPLEAMASGCPVVASDTSSIPEVVNDAGVYFDPNDIESIREAIEEVFFSNDIRSTLIENGFRNVEKFSWTKCTKETMSVYQNLIGNL